MRKLIALTTAIILGVIGLANYEPVISPDNSFSPTPTAPTAMSQAITLTGFGTTYDAYKHAGSWYDSPKTWVQVDPDNRWLTKSMCKKHPEYKCYWRDMGGWKKLVRPWSTTLNNMYAALGPKLRKYLDIPKWHTIPSKQIMVTSLVTGISVMVWIADYCDCRQGTKDPSNDSLIDLSPQVWAALGAYKDGHSLPNVKGWNNSIEVRFVP
jgi:hypothetical protein